MHGTKLLFFRGGIERLGFRVGDRYLHLFLCVVRKRLCLSLGIELNLIFVWVVETSLISVWGIEIDLIEVSEPIFARFMCGCSK